MARIFNRFVNLSLSAEFASSTVSFSQWPNRYLNSIFLSNIFLSLKNVVYLFFV